MRHEWTEGSGENAISWGADSDLGALLGGEPVDRQSCDAWPAEILRLAARVRELEAPITELLAKLKSCHEPSFDPVAAEALALIGVKQAALEEENRRLRAELLAKSDEIRQMGLELREEWPEPSE